MAKKDRGRARAEKARRHDPIGVEEVREYIRAEYGIEVPVSSIYTWARRGFADRKLERVPFGDRWFTTRAQVDAFLAPARGRGRRRGKRSAARDAAKRAADQLKREGF